MSEFKNVTETELELLVDGRRCVALPGETVTIPDEFDAQVLDQPAWEFADEALEAEAQKFRKERDEAFELGDEPVIVAQVEAIPVPAGRKSAQVESTTEQSSNIEGNN